MKRFCSFFLVLTLLLCALPSVFAAEEAFTWSFEAENATLRISGSGEMPHYAFQFTSPSGSSHPWAEYSATIERIIVEEGITSIGNYAFYNCPAVKEVQLPTGLREIGNFAFAYCRGLENLPLPETLQILGADTFFQCPSLKEIHLPAGIAEVPDHSFAYCSALERVTIPDSVTQIGASAFYGCGSMTELRLPLSLGFIGDAAFSRCGLLSLRLPESLEKISDSAFSYCSSLKEIHFNASLVSIGAKSFASCLSLQHVCLPDALAELGLGAFENCSALTEVCIGDALTSLPAGAFAQCSSLLSLRLPDTITDVWNDTFSGCQSLDHIVYTGKENQWQELAPLSKELSRVSVLHTQCIGNETHWEESPGGSYLYCDLCDAALTPIPSCEHKDPVIRGKKAASCLESGYSGDLYCENCDTVLEYGTSIPLLGHSFEEGFCIRCGEVDIRTSPFGDIDSTDYFYAPVLWAYYKEIAMGVSDTAFAPDAPCTRAQVVTFLWRAFGSPKPTEMEHPFTDLNPNMYYYSAVLWAVEQGITTGTSSTTFSPDETCTRGQVATFLWRACGKPAQESDNNPFSDVSVEDYYYEPILWAVEQGITNGTGKDRFSPEDSCSRGQIVTFLYRTLA